LKKTFIYSFIYFPLQGKQICKEKAKAIVVAAKEIGLEVNADKTKYMVPHVTRSECRTNSQYED
jgi:hypothetical protein